MRKFLLSAIALAAVTISFAAPSQAGGYYGNKHHGGHYGHYKHKKHYNDYSYNYRPTCRYKDIKVSDGYGYFHYETVKVCR